MKRAGGSTGTQKAAQLISQAKQSVGEKTARQSSQQPFYHVLATLDSMLMDVSYCVKQV
ncbi:hypothetical protein GCM10008018_20870 [Paenibacillus marchantiophytorum]|uniref:Uncharacterized protein n=1 Tax=Paenibacillus marchantiophytorum TaxID=1619310 RepID=A0ABQ1EKJ3_9BACL|nr:hypothetical protein [Paenibacillus marchantiophytorum]GFZ75686.1 hypothetical protein GCM10008018_20870 [Paenibacillus marchantiophytorum]